MANVVKQMIKVQWVILCPVRVTFGDGGQGHCPLNPSMKEGRTLKKIRVQFGKDSEVPIRPLNNSARAPHLGSLFFPTTGRSQRAGPI